MSATKLTNEQILELVKQGLSPTEIMIEGWGSVSGAKSARIRRVAESAGIRYEELRKREGKYSNKEISELKLRLSDREQIVSLEIKNGSILCGTDPHYCRVAHRSVAHRGFVEVIRELRPQIKAIILNGDIGDFGGVSRFPRGPWRNTKRPDVKEELEAIQERLGEIEGVCSRNIPLLRTLGNHDDRFEARLSYAAPQYEGVAGTRLKDHIPRWVECERIDVNQDTEILHNIRSGEVGRDRQNVFATGHHTVVGHSHQLHVYPQTWRRGTYYGVCAGTLADLDDEAFQYLGSRPANWQSGFVLLTWVDGKLLYPEIAHVMENRLYFRGKRYA